MCTPWIPPPTMIRGTCTSAYTCTGTGMFVTLLEELSTFEILEDLSLAGRAIVCSILVRVLALILAGVYSMTLQ